MTDIEIPIGKKTAKYRFFEMLPGLLSLTVIALPIVLSFFSPLLAAAFVLLYIITFFVKAVASAARTIQGYNTVQKAQNVDWRQRLADLEHPAHALQSTADFGWRHKTHLRNLDYQANTKETLKPSQIYNAVIIATYNETEDILRPTIEAVLASDYDKKNLIIVIAYEERGGPATEALAKKLVKEYGDQPFAMMAFKHPPDLPNEVVGKGGNITWAGKQLQKWLKKQKIDSNDVIVTTLDSDNRVHPKYFAYVTYEYIVTPDRRLSAFQPIALFLNNIWDVPAPMRILATGNSFFNIVNSQRPHMLRNFAAHSQPMAALEDTNFWSTRTIVEDGHQYWRSYFTYDSTYEVLPIYVPIYQDAVLAEGYWRTFRAQFIQVRRWAYGASDVAYVADKAFRKGRTVPFFDVFGKFVRLLEGHVSWAAASIVLFFGAWTPLLLNTESSRSIVAHQLPVVASTIQQMAMVGLLVTVFLTMKMLPPRPKRYKRRRSVLMVVQWVLMPFVTLGFGSASALNSQMRLLTGRYLDKFDVTEKAVKK